MCFLISYAKHVHPDKAGLLWNTRAPPSYFTTCGPLGYELSRDLALHRLFPWLKRVIADDLISNEVATSELRCAEVFQIARGSLMQRVGWEGRGAQRRGKQGEGERYPRVGWDRMDEEVPYGLS